MNEEIEKKDLFPVIALGDSLHIVDRLIRDRRG